MPLVMTRGSASAKAFGWTRKLGSGGYAFMGQQSPVSNNVYGGATIAGMTQLAVQPTNVTLKTIGLVTDGSFIAQAGNQYSLNAGVSWTTWASVGSYTFSGMPPGVNGSIAYNPTAKRAFCYFTEYEGKANVFYGNIRTVTSTGSTTGYRGPTFYSSQGGFNVLYSPALNVFYVANFSNSNSSWWYANGTTGTAGAQTSAGAPGNMVAGISHNGYPIQAAYAGFGTTYYLREYTSADLSTYTQYGSVSVGNSNAVHSPFFWAPVNNKYLAASAPSTGGTISIYAATSADPSTYTNIAGFSAAGAAGYISANFIEETNGTLWVFGQYGADAGKGQRATTNYNWYSTDGGFQWFPKTGTTFVALAKNFTP